MKALATLFRDVNVADLSASRDPSATREAIASGADVIFQAPLRGAGGFYGIADFLVRTTTVHVKHRCRASCFHVCFASSCSNKVFLPNLPRGSSPSTLPNLAVLRQGSARYEVWDAKLAKRPSPAYLVQLCCYSEMLSELQAIAARLCIPHLPRPPPRLAIVLC